MPSLRDLQLRVANAILGDDADAGAIGVIGGKLSGAQRLRVYRNNVTATLSNALRSCYPVVEALVGVEFFGFLARHYLRTMPSVAGDVREYGADLPEFVAGFPALAALPYLADVARLEWALQEAYYAAEPLGGTFPIFVDPVGNSQYRTENWECPHFCLDPLQENWGCPHFSRPPRLHPSARIVASPYPILTIWRANQPGADPALVIDLASGAERVLVIRRAYSIELELLSAGAQVLLESLARGVSCASACESALAAEPRLDISALLRAHVARRTITGFSG
jgi:hypothetical protein